MIDPGLQRLPTGAAREIIEHQQAELETDAENQREARAARKRHSRFRAGWRRLRQQVSRLGG